MLRVKEFYRGTFGYLSLFHTMNEKILIKSISARVFMAKMFSKSGYE